LEHTDTLQVRNGVRTVQGFWRLKRSTVPAAVPNCVLAGDARFISRLMANHDIIIQNHSQLKRFRNAKCDKCKKPFVIKDMIHTISNPRQGRKRYHKKCWDSKYH